MLVYEIKYKPVFAGCDRRKQPQKTGTGSVTVNVLANDAEHAINRAREHAINGSPEPSDDTCEPSFKVWSIVVIHAIPGPEIDLV